MIYSGHKMFDKIKKLIASKGFLYLFTRFFGRKLRRESFDKFYQSGQWNYLDQDHSPEMVKVVEKYANKGRVLDVGCGPGILASMLDNDSFEYYLGIDASSEAIALAEKRKSNKVDFKVGEIQTPEGKDTFDLIVFEESLYYVPFGRYQLLRKYAEMLLSDGKFVVTVADPRRFRGMIRMIRKNFHILEDKSFRNSKRLLLVFQV